MAATPITRGRLRRLSELRPERGRVLSVFVDLDPAEFATPAARSHQFRSLIDAAGRQAEALSGELSRDELMALRADIDRLGQILRADTDLAKEGTRAAAIFLCGTEGFEEIVRLPFPADPRAVIDTRASIETLAAAGEPERWAVLLASRKNAKIFLGTPHGLEQVEELTDDVHGQHAQGGWSQPRYQRSVDEERDKHLAHAADVLFRRYRRDPFGRLVLGAPQELYPIIEEQLHPYLRERLAGTIQVDVDTAGADTVLQATAPVVEEARAAREAELLERLDEGLAKDRAASGLEAVMAALTMARVETLLLSSTETGYDEAVEQALDTGADVVSVTELDAYGGIAALLRY